ncbi:hypothetical protein ACFQ12_21935 [Methylobacterium trifolii]
MLVASLVPAGARAADIALDLGHSTSASLVRLSGTILPRELYKVEDVVAEARQKRPGKPIVFVLNSRGGHHFEGMVIGLFLKRKGIGTAIPPGATCESACGSIFFGGSNARTGKPDRVVYEGGRLGVHRWRRADGGQLTVQESDRAQGGAAWFLDQVAISKAVQTKVFETPPASMYYLTAEDLAGSTIPLRSAAAAPKM